MKQEQLKRELKSLFISIIIIILTIVFGSLLLLKANGYIIDFGRFRAEKAGLLVVKPIPNDAQTTINGKNFQTSILRPYFLIFPGSYDLTIAKDDYRDWQKSIDLDPGEAEIFENILLFLSKPVLLETRMPTKSELSTLPVGEGLRINDGEIWLQKEQNEEMLVTRLSSSIIGAVKFGQRNIIFQTGSEVHVIDQDGSNDIKLLDLDNKKPILLVPKFNFSRILIILSEQEAQEYQVR